MDLSVIIPARNEKYLQKTIDSVLANIEADTEIIVVLDGQWPDETIPNNPRVIIIFHPEPRGQRQSINEAARIARGKYIMKLDAHCAVGPGFDRILMEDYQEGWTVVPRMYNLNVETWQPKLHKKTDYMYIGCAEGKLLRAEYYSKQPYSNKLIDETMCCMGPGWFLSKETFWNQDGCDEAHGSWGQQGVEVSLKAWLSGGALMVNKKTWFAHYFRGNVGWPYDITNKEVEHARKYSRDLWLNDKWPKATRKFQWLLDKFDPPGWDARSESMSGIHGTLYRHFHTKNNEPHWRGIQVVKFPNDLLLYHQVIWQCAPKYIVEIGTRWGGSAIFLQDMLDIVHGPGVGQVITIDKHPENIKQIDERVMYVNGRSGDRSIIKMVREMVAGHPTMVSVDGNHDRIAVKWDLVNYAPLVTSGQYLVVEDCYVKDHVFFGPGEARDWFLKSKHGQDFELTSIDEQFMTGVCLGGWLKRK